MIVAVLRKALSHSAAEVLTVALRRADPEDPVQADALLALLERPEEPMRSAG